MHPMGRYLKQLGEKAMKGKLLKKSAAILVAALCLAPAMTSCRTKTTTRSAATSSFASQTESGMPGTQTASSSCGSDAASVISLGTVTASATEKSVSQQSYSSKTVFGGKSSTKETKISLNNGKIKAPSIPASAPAASVVKRTDVEGVDGSFSDAKLTESVRNLGGKTYTFATSWTDAYENGKNATKDARRCAQAIADIEKDYNCTIKIIPLDATGKEIITDKASGIVYANIINCFASDGNNFINNVAADLRGVKTVGIGSNQWNPVQTLVSSYKSKVFGVGVRYDWLEQDILFYNQTLASKYNLGNFYGMVSGGKWNDDLFLQVCQAFKKASNSGYTVCSSMYPTHLFDQIYTNWTSPFAITQQKYIFNGSDSSVLDILNFLQSFVKDGLFDKTYVSGDMKTDGTFKNDISDYTRAAGNFKAGKSLFFFGSNALLQEFHDNSKNPYGLLPLPKGPAADSYSSVITNCRFFSLLNGDPDIENSGALLTAIANRTNIKVADIVTNNQALVMDSDSLSTLTNNYKYKQILNVTLSKAGSLADVFNGAAVNCVINQSETPKQAMDSIAVKAQTAINTAYGQ